MNNNEKEYLKKSSKALTYFTFNNGPIKTLKEEGKIKEEEVKEIQKYIEGHLGYILKVLLQEGNIEKFNLIVSTLDKFYVNDNEDVEIKDDGFDNIYKNLFNMNTGIQLNK